MKRIEPLTAKERERAWRICELASPGPWESRVASGDSMQRLEPGTILRASTQSWAVGPGHRSLTRAERDAAFIAEARDLLPRALATADCVDALAMRLTEVLEECEQLRERRAEALLDIEEKRAFIQRLRVGT